MSKLTRTPLGRVRGLGSAKDGTDHFWRERITSVALLPLTIFFVAVIVFLAGADHARAAAVLSSPWSAGPMLLVVLTTIVHMRLGMQVIIEDYVHSEGPKVALLIANSFFCAIIGLIGTFAILKLAFGA